MHNNTALVIIDVQLGMFDDSDPVYNGNELLATIGALISRARTSGISVIYIQHDGGDNHPLRPDKPGWPIHAAIAPTKDDLVIRKRHPDSFQETSFQRELETRGIKHLIVAGIQTECCIDTTCRRAYSLGYDVTLVQDAHSTWDTEYLKASQIIAHHNQVLGGWFVTVKTATEIQFGKHQS
ncbi:MAG: cysteine hydrolase [Chloroflexi bacterium HGW-Chloroflexi-1]|nr:MAG: cysteine hydrolase [Chloroflexi bacterium HGW-Chloroflexi-1]